MDKNRVILIVMDSLGVGELPDAGSYGDAGSDTFGHIAKTMGDELKIPNLRRLGFGNIDGLCQGDGALLFLILRVPMVSLRKNQRERIP